jgi:hypothetical protein
MESSRTPACMPNRCSGRTLSCPTADRGSMLGSNLAPRVLFFFHHILVTPHNIKTHFCIHSIPPIRMVTPSIHPIHYILISTQLATHLYLCTFPPLSPSQPALVVHKDYPLHLLVLFCFLYDII